MLEISIQSGGLCSNWSPRDAYRMIREAGFDGIDWNIDTAWDNTRIRARHLDHCIFEDSIEEITAYYQEELNEIRANGLTIFQAHAPFPAYVKDFPEFNDYAIRILQQCIRFCDHVGVKYLVVHGISLSLEDYTQTPDTIREMNLYLYKSLIPVLQETSVVVCLENLFTSHGQQRIEGICSVPEEAIWYLDTLNDLAGKDCFGFCVDTGHLNLLGKRQDVFIRRLGSRIKILHLHDNLGREDEHLAPYTGNIIWKDVLSGLKDIGYTGNLNFETFRQILPSRIDPAAAPAWLCLIHEIGMVFRDRISA